MTQRYVEPYRLCEKPLSVSEFIDGMMMLGKKPGEVAEIKERIAGRQLMSIARAAHLDCVGCPFIDLRMEAFNYHSKDTQRFIAQARCKKSRCVHDRIGMSLDQAAVTATVNPTPVDAPITYQRLPTYDESVEMARKRMLDLRSQVSNRALEPDRRAVAEAMLHELTRRTEPKFIERQKLLMEQEELAKLIEVESGQPLEVNLPPKPEGWGDW